MTPLLDVQNLVKSYGGHRVVNDLSFSVQRGEIVGLLGPNGAGKTTAFYMTIGLVRPDQGRVQFQERDVTRMTVDQRARMGMGYLAQEPSVFRGMTVRDNIRCILQTLPLTRAQQRHRLDALLCELNLAPLAHKRASTLSGGERRRLEITRALVTNPSFLLLDEPFANIDPIAIHDLKELTRHLASRGISVLITDHNAREIFSLVDRCYIVQAGRVIVADNPKKLIHHEEARIHYLGNNFEF